MMESLSRTHSRVLRSITITSTAALSTSTRCDSTKRQNNAVNRSGEVGRFGSGQNLSSPPGYGRRYGMTGVYGSEIGLAWEGEAVLDWSGRECFGRMGLFPDGIEPRKKSAWNCDRSGLTPCICCSPAPRDCLAATCLWTCWEKVSRLRCWYVLSGWHRRRTGSKRSWSVGKRNWADRFRVR